jgi:hypothetical protein
MPEMADRFRLVFRGELLEGQHPAVVRKRLGQALSLDDRRLERLFAGGGVVVRSDTDAKTAERLQALFRKAGASLHVEPLEAAPQARESERLELLPAGSDVLREDERQPWSARDVDTSGLTLAERGADLGAEEPPAPPSAPDTSHLTLADPDPVSRS